MGPEGADHPFREGDVLAGKYRIERVLGAGGMGVVLSAQHIRLGERVALKFLLPRGASHPETVARFLREAQAAVRIKSEHVARISDVAVLENGMPYIVMEHLAGRDLADTVKSKGALPIDVAVGFVLQACEAIAEAHSLGIVHRDLKPSNLFVTRRADGSHLVKVLDFGISKLTRDEGAQAQSLTHTTAMMGSPLYASPEQIRNAKRADARSDIWSLGVVSFELVSGSTPFVAETVHGLLAAIVADEPRKLRQVMPSAPPELEAVLARCLEKEPSRRFSNVAELASALYPFAPSARVSVDRISNILASVRMDGTVDPLSSDGPTRLMVIPPSVAGPAQSATVQLSSSDLSTVATTVAPTSETPPFPLLVTDGTAGRAPPADVQTLNSWGRTDGAAESALASAPKPRLVALAAGLLVLAIAAGAGLFVLERRSNEALPISVTSATQPSAATSPSLPPPAAAGSTARTEDAVSIESLVPASSATATRGPAPVHTRGVASAAPSARPPAPPPSASAKVTPKPASAGSDDDEGGRR